MWRLMLVVAIPLTVGGCASTGAVPRPFPTPGDRLETPARQAPEAILSADGYAIAGTALSFRGVRYRNGGSDPSGFDCSGLVQYVLARHGIWMPRAVGDQARAGVEVMPDAIEPGDLLFFTTVSPRPSHVGIAIGGDQFIHAPNSRGTVRVDSLSSSYWGSRYLAARRIRP